MARNVLQRSLPNPALRAMDVPFAGPQPSGSLCSCFNDKTGQYDYFSTAQVFPYNSDLPTPKLPGVAGNVGVPAIDAGRPIPADASYVGSGWTAKGTVVSCGRGAVSGLGSDTTEPFDWARFARRLSTPLLCAAFVHTVSKGTPNYRAKWAFLTGASLLAADYLADALRRKPAV